MAKTLTIRVTDLCSGGEHGKFTVTGDFTGSFPGAAQELRDARSRLNDMGLREQAILLAALHAEANNLTPAQWRNALVSGITITI